MAPKADPAVAVAPVVAPAPDNSSRVVVRDGKNWLREVAANGDVVVTAL